ncbi:DNA polymerase III subunit gamma and tau [Pseudactinotalea suaedae]|uniref:DNA polymerase III subunit gamma and tau n=1 Tax=Pseudactinotalea suaedae TaxID=1524924 RepID=UPI0012E2768D|nr:DNA polymerase III subunit gamma and tau [Pseudactinotalea suaedae]
MSTALYRRYRPDSFADVIGQEHVTDPLMAALRGGRVTHAYLFSGPRGCGKTTSARIFARCLNCANGPTDTPCGTCDSCVDLARGGTGSLDVVELDAASHGGVDDARELRERAAFAPARDRYKIFIIDEAHMVTTQGFNALLKLVEEPPEHVKFVFATTEPEKVIGTIRSRTHHYPFRLVPPEQLLDYLGKIADEEGVQVAAGVLPLVVRAGGGSVRDSLSVLDQLIAGASDEGVTYERAVALLGFTHATLLDDAAEALAARDGASLFRVVDRVISTGHAPRRFVEDLLERLRDLIVVLAAGEQAGSVLRTVPADQLERMRTQAQHLGLANASRAADLTNLALTEMVGATSPRLQLELLCARLLLPAADDGVDGVNARLERLEAGGAGLATGRPIAVVAPPVQTAQPVAATPEPARAAVADVPPAASAEAAESAPSASAEAPQPIATAPAEALPAPEQPVRPSRPAPAEQQPEPQPAPVQQVEPVATPTAGATDGLTTEQVRHRWPEVLSTLAQVRRITWALAQNAQVVDLSGGVLKIGFPSSGLVSTFRNGPHTEPLQRALTETLGLEARIEAVVEGEGPVATAAAAPPVDRAAEAAADWARPARQPEPAPSQPAPQPRAQEPAPQRARDNGATSAPQPQASGPDRRPPWEDDPGQPPAEEPPPAEPPSEPAPPVRSARERIQAAQAAAAPAPNAVVDEPDASDPNLEDSGLVGAPLVTRMLGGTVIDEYFDEDRR